MTKAGRLKVLAALVGVSLAGVVGTAQALTLSLASPTFVGRINDGIPSSPADEVTYVNTLKGLAPGAAAILIGTETYDRVGSSLAMVGSPAAVLLGAVKNDSGNNSFTISGTVKYILAKYDADKAGSWVWYNSSGFTGNIVLPSVDPLSDKYGLSHFTVFNPDGDLDLDVPEPGSLALLGLGLIGLGLVRRRQTA